MELPFSTFEIKSGACHRSTSIPAVKGQSPGNGFRCAAALWPSRIQSPFGYLHHGHPIDLNSREVNCGRRGTTQPGRRAETGAGRRMDLCTKGLERKRERKRKRTRDTAKADKPLSLLTSTTLSTTLPSSHSQNQTYRSAAPIHLAKWRRGSILSSSGSKKLSSSYVGDIQPCTCGKVTLSSR